MRIREWKREDLPGVSGLLTELCALIGHPYQADQALLERHFREMADRPGHPAVYPPRDPYRACNLKAISSVKSGRGIVTLSPFRTAMVEPTISVPVFVS